jgi:hypothetical protein
MVTSGPEIPAMIVKPFFAAPSTAPGAQSTWLRSCRTPLSMRTHAAPS